RIRLEEQLVEFLAVLQALPELRCLAAQLRVRQRLELRLERGDVPGLLLQAFHPPPLAEAESLLERAELRHGHSVPLPAGRVVRRACAAAGGLVRRRRR